MKKLGYNGFLIYGVLPKLSNKISLLSQAGVGQILLTKLLLGAACADAKMTTIKIGQPSSYTEKKTIQNCYFFCGTVLKKT